MFLTIWFLNRVFCLIIMTLFWLPVKCSLKFMWEFYQFTILQGTQSLRRQRWVVGCIWYVHFTSQALHLVRYGMWQFLMCAYFITIFAYWVIHFYHFWTTDYALWFTLNCLCRWTNCRFQHYLRCHIVDGGPRPALYVKMRDSPGLAFALVVMLACVELTSMSLGEKRGNFIVFLSLWIP